MRKGFTLVELMVIIAIIATLTLGVFQIMGRARMRANQSVSTANLRSLVIANMGYVSDHGTYCPAQEKTNRTRWHGARTGMKSRFDPARGFLSPYFGESDRVGICPQFREHMEAGSFESGSGGYGYNAIYIGGTPSNPFKPEKPANVNNPASTIMFATTALAKKNGLQEYPFAEPWRAVNPSGGLASSQQPSVHFRFGGKALIAWCDGHVTAVKMDGSSTENHYGGNNQKAGIGFFGISDNNGNWNPRN